MDILKIIFRIAINLFKEIPFTPRRLRAARWLSRRRAASRITELERLDRIRQPWKYRGE